MTASIPELTRMLAHHLVETKAMSYSVTSDKKGPCLTLGGISDTKVSLSRPHILTLNPTAGAATGLPTSSSPIEFRIQPGVCPRIEHMYLRWNIKNMDGKDTVTPTIAALQVNKIEVGFQSDPTCIQRITGDHMWIKMFKYSPTELTQQNAAVTQNLDTTNMHCNATAIAGGGNRTYQISLSSLLMNHGRINPKSISGDIIVRVFMNDLIVHSTITASLPQLNGMWMDLLVKRDSVVLANDLKALSVYSLRTNYLDVQPFTISHILTAGVKYEIPLQGVIGWFAGFTYRMRVSRAVLNGAVTAFTALDPTTTLGPDAGTIDLVDTDNNSIFGIARNDHDLRCTLTQEAGVPSDFFQKNAVYPYWFANPALLFDPKAGISGVRYLTGQEKLVIIPGANYVEGSAVNIDIDFYKIVGLQQSRGLLRTIPL